MKPFIVAEMSANHLGSLERALSIVEEAAWAGADAIKLQTWWPDSMCIDRSYVLDHGPWAGRSLFDLYREAWTPWEWHPAIFKRARELGLIPFSAAFDRESVDFLETLGVDRHKVASFEITDLPLIRYMASKGKGMILSLGMADPIDKWAAVDVARTCNRRVTLLHCVSAYPAAWDSFNLTAMLQTSDCLPGLSDHSLGCGVAVAAVALGATMIEKHLTLSRADGGPDAGFSMEPAEFKQMVEECRRAALAVKGGWEAKGTTELRRSLWVTRDVAPGEPLRLGINVVTARPELGLHPDTDLQGKTASRHLTAGMPLTQEMLT